MSQERADRFLFRTECSPQSVIFGVQQLWALPESEQKLVLGEAIKRWDRAENFSHSLYSLGLNLNAEDLIRGPNRRPGTILNRGELTACLLMGNLSVYPLAALLNLENTNLLMGIWDGLGNEEGGYYYQQALHSGENPGPVIFPCRREDVARLWEGPFLIPRLQNYLTEHHSFFKEKERFALMDEAPPRSGIIVMEPGVFYLFGMWPALKIKGLCASLGTRSNFARWGFNGMVNSDMVWNGFNGVLTAEALVLNRQPFAIFTHFLPFQVSFSLIDLSPDDLSSLGRMSPTFGQPTSLPLEQAVRNFKPEDLLPKPIGFNMERKSPHNLWE